MGGNRKEPRHISVKKVIPTCRKIKTEKNDFISSLCPINWGIFFFLFIDCLKCTHQSVYDVNRRSFSFLINSELPRLNGHIGGSLHSVIRN